jgi:nucleotide-binding universal stress UspA family protein
MIKRILLCVDFSESDEHVINYSTELARQLGASIDLLHVVAPEPDFVGYAAHTYPGRDERAHELRDEKAELAKLIDQIETGGVSATGHMKEAPTVDGILEVAGKHGQDMIVIGSHSKGAITTLLLGSVAKDVVKRSRVPVLVVPPSP